MREGRRPTSLNSRQVVNFKSSGPFIVTSQDDKHPFYISAHMLGGDNFGGNGDPEFVNVIPPKQYLAKYLFMTDPTMGWTTVVLVRVKAKDNTFKPVTLDCVGDVGGWKAVGPYEYAYVDLVKNKAPVGKCDNGLHEIHSDAPFGITVWGWDSYVSYAYPGGASVKPINTVVVPPLPK